MVLGIFFLSHWIGDFVLQTTRMALNKGNSIKWLTLHVLTYISVMLVFALFIFDWQTALQFCGLNFALHWVTDFFTSKLSSKYRDQPRIFFPILGFDQFIHAICIIYTVEWYS